MCESFTENILNHVMGLVFKFISGHFFSFIALLGCKVQVLFKDCNQIVIICTSLYMHICKCNSKMPYLCNL